MYEPKKALNSFGSALQYSEMPLPEDQVLSPELIDALANLPGDMELPVIGTLTPWATKKNDFEWDAITTAPLRSIKIYEISAEQVRKGYDKLFGQPIPFLGVVSSKQLTASQVQFALEGSDYELYETIAVYSQGDKQAIPDVQYFYWLSMGPEGQKRSKSLQQAVTKLQGNLVFASLVPYEETSSRSFPAVSFEMALDRDFTELSGTDVENFENPEVVPAVSDAKVSIVGPLVCGFAAAALTVVVGKALSK